MAETLTADFDNLELEDSDADEDYEDVCETLPPSEVDLLSAVKLSREIVILFLNNRVAEAVERIKPFWNHSIYHALVHAAMTTGIAFLRFQKEDLLSAVEIVKECSTLVNRRRHRSSLTNNMVTKMVIRPNYDTYTDEECHAEICYADLLIMRALLIFGQEGSLFSYLKGGLRIRKAYYVYKECEEILEHRAKWDDEHVQREFQSGTDVAAGVFNLIISSLPPRLAKFLRFLGFDSNKDVGLMRLNRGHKRHDTVRGFLCSGGLLAYTCAIRFFLTYPRVDENMFNYCEQLFEPFRTELSDGILVDTFDGRMNFMKGNIQDSIKCYNRANNVFITEGISNVVSVFELSWIHVVLGEWRKAVDYMDILCKECNWSKCLFFYLKGAILGMLPDRTPEEYEEMVSCMREVPKHLRRYLGRSLPVEKYCFRRAERFFAQDNWLPLPAYEMLYASNYFYLLKGKIELLEPIMVQIDRAIIDLQEGDYKDSEWHVDNYCLAVFLKGLCLAYMGYPLSAEEYFLEVIQNKPNVTKDIHYVSFAQMEMGYIAKDTGNYELALEYFLAARSSSIFITEFRIHQGIQQLKSKGYYDKDDIEDEAIYHNK